MPKGTRRLAILIACFAAAAQAGQDQWTPIGPAGQDVLALTVFQASSNSFLYAATRTSGVYVTTDGVQWTPLSTGLPSAAITSLAISPAPLPPCPDPCPFPPALLAGTGGAGVFRSHDGGVHWTSVNNGLANLNVAALASAPGTNVAYAATPAGLFKTTDEAATWTLLGGGLGPGVTTVALAPQAPSIVYAGMSGTPPAAGSVFRSADAGATWIPATAGVPAGASALALAVDPRASSTIYGSFSTASGYRVYKSVDSGSNWIEADSGLGAAGRVASLAIDPTSPATLYAGASAGVFRSTDAGTTWTAVNAGLSNTNVQALAGDPINASRIYAGTAGAGVFVDTFSTGSCGAQTLCLVSGRFQVQVTWNDHGQIRAAQATPITPSTGSFWFLTSDNLELTVKVLDGRSVNGKWWIFLGALSNIEYTVVVTDTLTLSTRTYFNPSGHLASVADTSAF